jgi:hypothetical protein
MILSREIPKEESPLVPRLETFPKIGCVLYAALTKVLLVRWIKQEK